MSLSQKMSDAQVSWEADSLEGGMGYRCVWCGGVLYQSERIRVLATSTHEYRCCIACAHEQAARLIGEANASW